MSGNTIWKFLLTAFLVLIAVLYLNPLSDTPFDEYLLSQSDKSEAFVGYLDDAKAVAEIDSKKSVYSALRAIAIEQQVDLIQYFPGEFLEASLVNIEKRNDEVLKAMLGRSKSSLQKGLDLKGGVSVTLQLPVNVDVPAGQVKEDLSKALEIIAERVNGMGLTEPIIRSEGENRIVVQMPGVSLRNDPEVIATIIRPARLEFSRVFNGRYPTGPFDTTTPSGYVIKEIERTDNEGKIQTSYYFVKRIPEMTGEAIKSAWAVPGQFGGFEILMNFTNQGEKDFARITTDISSESRATGRPGLLAIVLDHKLYTAPQVNEPILNGSARISGDFTAREAQETAQILENPLEFELEVTEMYEVSPTMAKDSIDSSIQAFMIGGGLVVLFMLIYYMVAGVVAMVTVAVNILLVLGALAMYGATLTLPGIAALVLTVGMAVDANILIFERMREELRSGKNLKAALSGGFEKALSTIVDANVTTLITAVILILFGTGSVKGFGVTLAIGICATMFGALIVSRWMLDILINKEIIKRMLTVSLLKPTKIEFLHFRKIAFATSWLIVLIGAVTVYMHRDHIYGIDFTGGEEITFVANEELSSKIVEELGEAAGLTALPYYSTQTSLNGDTYTKIQTPVAEGQQFWDALKVAYPDQQDYLGMTEIGASVGEEIKMNALVSVTIALACILLYVALRFEIGFGVGAVVATVHDVLMTIGVFVMLGGQFSAPMIAALLMIVGYSINDTIVVFDRIREELDLNPTMKLWNVVNLAINRTLSRTLLTSLTTLLVTVSLLIFGTGIIRDFAITFCVGILTGTFSSIFIASPVFYAWHKGQRRHVDSGADLKPTYEWETGSKKG